MSKVTEIIKKYRRLIPQLAILTITATTLVTGFMIMAFNSTFSWFAKNIQVSGSGMGVQVDVTPNLVISDSSTAISGYSESGWNSSYVEKTWSESPLELIPVDHYTSTDYPVVDGENVFNLVYNMNPENVVRNTGKGTDLAFAHVPSDGENTYFIDRIVYIASLNREMTKGNDYSILSFSIEENGNGTTTNGAYKSASVDVYVNNSFKGTLNLDSLDSFSITDINTIPFNEDGSIQITFRCYFDGALQDSNDSTKNYVNSTDLAISTANIFINITISLE